MSVILDHSENRQFQTESAYRLPRNGGVSVAAVDKQQIGQRRKVRVPVHIALKAPEHRLIHTRVVVLKLKSLDAKALVVTLSGLSVHVHGHRRDDSGRAEV